MVWLLALLALLGVVIFLYAKSESMAREHKRVLAQFRLADMDSQYIQQTTYELADALSLTLANQLQASRRLSRFDVRELELFELGIQALPFVCKEMLQRKQSLSSALQRACRQISEQDPAQLEALIERHGRLIQHWQRNDFVGYMQLCQQMVALTQEFSHKEQLRPVAN